MAASDQGPSLLSRTTIEVPLVTRHFPTRESFNDNNWGVFVDVALDRHWSVAAGHFRNSYGRNTLFAGVAYLPIQLELSHATIRAGGMLGFDLNGGYQPYNDLHPLLGAFSLKLTGARFEKPGNQLLNRLGLSIKAIPPDPGGGSTAVNLALTLRLGPEPHW